MPRMTKHQRLVLCAREIRHRLGQLSCHDFVDREEGAWALEPWSELDRALDQFPLGDRATAKGADADRPEGGWTDLVPDSTYGREGD